MQKDYSSLLKKLRHAKPKQIDSLFLELHIAEMNNIKCLECANCCKSLGPRITNTDIERLSSFLKMKSVHFIEKYLRIDEDNDYVFKSMPCPFLDEDNYCTVYKVRPKACKDYPHTNQKNILSIMDICVKNIDTCPVVRNIFVSLEKMRLKS
ncbi:MAG: YkgJ family cysteine cluster protein, partial [Bacteroidales bacterium]|nr:YkgJ family cysteine cluster protein [Bacteroidales bacterium]